MCSLVCQPCDLNWIVSGHKPPILEKLGSKPNRGGRVQVYSFHVWKNRFVQGKITQIFVPILKQDFVSSQSAFIQEINTSEILRINLIQN